MMMTMITGSKMGSGWRGQCISAVTCAALGGGASCQFRNFMCRLSHAPPHFYFQVAYEPAQDYFWAPTTPLFLSFSAPDPHIPAPNASALFLLSRQTIMLRPRLWVPSRGRQVGFASI
eukprot:2665607-Rhodomonas_salina.1